MKKKLGSLLEPFVRTNANQNIVPANQREKGSNYFTGPGFQPNDSYLLLSARFKKS